MGMVQKIQHFRLHQFRKKNTMITKIVIFCIIGAAYAAPEAKSFSQYGIAECKFPDGNSAIYISEFVDDTKIFGHMYGLTDGLHAWHVHEFGDLGDGCKAAGGHFDPNQTEDETGTFVGDLGTVNFVDGRVAVELHKPDIKVSGPEDFSVMNRAIVVHQDPPPGGARVMCCLIKDI